MRFVRRLQKDGRIVIPKYIRDMWGLQKGDSIIFEIKNNQVIIRKSKE